MSIILERQSLPLGSYESHVKVLPSYSPSVSAMPVSGAKYNHSNLAGLFSVGTDLRPAPTSDIFNLLVLGIERLTVFEVFCLHYSAT